MGVVCRHKAHSHALKKREGKKEEKGGSVGKKKTRKKKMDVNGPKNKNSYTPLKFGGLKEIGVQWI